MYAVRAQDGELTVKRKILAPQIGGRRRIPHTELDPEDDIADSRELAYDTQDLYFVSCRYRQRDMDYTLGSKPNRKTKRRR